MPEIIPTIRPAHLGDLEEIYAVFYENEVVGDPHPPPPRDTPPPYLRHIQETGRMVVAEQAGRIVAFTALIRRSNVAFLTDLFVRRRVQSTHLGTALLRQVLPRDAPIRCTMSSSDVRALSLYVRAGMQPRWPHVIVRAPTGVLASLPETDVQVEEAQPADPDLVRWDAGISGRQRPEELAFWVREEGAVPLWFSRRGVILGYGLVRLGAGTAWDPEAATIGPIGVRLAEDAAACVLAAVAWARSRAPVLRLSVPGPHPSLAPLLAARFQIRYLETFCSSAEEPFFDAQRYLSSGSDLL